MKRLVPFAVVLTFVVGFATAPSRSNDEREMVRQAVLDYVEGVYQ